MRSGILSKEVCESVVSSDEPWCELLLHSCLWGLGLKRTVQDRFFSLGCAMDLGFFLVIVLALLVSVANIHSCALDAFAFGSAYDGSIHAEDVTIVVFEDRGRHLQDSRHESRLDQLELELPRRFVAEDCAVVREIELEVVLTAEGLSEDGFGDERADIVVV